MSESTNESIWKPQPKNEEEISPYLDWLFKFAGNNLWSKLVRDQVTKEMSEKFNPKGSKENKDNKKRG